MIWIFSQGWDQIKDIFLNLFYFITNSNVENMTINWIRLSISWLFKSSNVLVSLNRFSFKIGMWAFCTKIVHKAITIKTNWICSYFLLQKKCKRLAIKRKIIPKRGAWAGVLFEDFSFYAFMTRIRSKKKVFCYYNLLNLPWKIGNPEKKVKYSDKQGWYY